MGQYNLECIFKPRHVVVVGASEKAVTIGNALIRNLIEVGFAGKRDREIFRCLPERTV
jgi:acetyltransferase